MTKRVVLQYTTGPYQSMFQIVGTEDQLPHPEVGSLPSFVGDLSFSDGRKGGASLVKVKPRYILYRELIMPSDRTFHPEQQ